VQAEDTDEARRTVLLVEDERSIRTFATRVLRRAGYRVVTAEDGDSALEALRRPGQTVDLLLTDVLMPGMSGAELAERVRAEHPAMPVLFVSGFPADLATGERLVPHGVQLLAKPFTGGQLVERVRMALDSHDENSEASSS
jgi:two-component system, cell cycle sensor histidine kinase and response regulator CckA